MGIHSNYRFHTKRRQGRKSPLLPSFFMLFPHEELLELPDLRQLLAGELFGAFDAGEAQEKIRAYIVQPADLHQQLVAGGISLLLPAPHRANRDIQPSCQVLLGVSVEFSCFRQ